MSKLYSVTVMTPFYKTLIIRAKAPQEARSVIYGRVADEDVLDVFPGNEGSEQIVGPVTRLSKEDVAYYEAVSQ